MFQVTVHTNPSNDEAVVIYAESEETAKSSAAMFAEEGYKVDVTPTDNGEVWPAI